MDPTVSDNVCYLYIRNNNLKIKNVFVENILEKYDNIKD